MDRFETFTVLISKIARSIRKIKDEEVNEYNLKGPHVSCLYYLNKMGPLTSKELCDICTEDKAQISRSISYLQKNGFIENDNSSKKRYKTTLNLSPLGIKTSNMLAEKIDKFLDIASVGLSQEDRIIMYKSLNLISNNLEKICTEYNGED